MTLYVRNRRCPCVRCRTMRLIGPAILITLGVLLLLNEYWIVSLDKSWPVLLIVIGLLSYAAHSGSMEGHIQPSWVPRTFSQGQDAGGITGAQSGLGSQQGGEPRR